MDGSEGMKDNSIEVKARVFLERISLWAIRYVSLMTFLGVAYLNYDKGNIYWFAICFIGAAITLATAFVDYKMFVGKETSIFLSRSSEWRDMRKDVKAILENKKTEVL